MLLLIAVIVLLLVWAFGSGGGESQRASTGDDAKGGPAKSITPGPRPEEALIDQRPGGRDESADDEGGDSGAGPDDPAGWSGDGVPGGVPGDGSGHDGTGAGGVGDLPSCVSEDVALSLRGTENEYPMGQEPELLLTAQNSSAGSCKLDLGSTALTVTVSDSADDLVWTSTTCPADAGSVFLAVPAGGAATHTVHWDRRHDTGDCDGRAGRLAAAGTYLAEAELAGFLVVQTTFRLDAD